MEFILQLMVIKGMAELFYKAITDNNLPTGTIVCFGDSITTHYPEYLEDLFEVAALSIGALSLKEQVTTYPNPVSNSLTVSFENTDLNRDQTTIALYRISGKKIIEAKENGTYQIEFDVSKLVRGIYFLKVSDASKSITKKIVKL